MDGCVDRPTFSNAVAGLTGGTHSLTPKQPRVLGWEVEHLSPVGVHYFGPEPPLPIYIDGLPYNVSLCVEGKRPADWFTLDLSQKFNVGPNPKHTLNVSKGGAPNEGDPDWVFTGGSPLISKIELHHQYHKGILGLARSKVGQSSSKADGGGNADGDAGGEAGPSEHATVSSGAALGVHLDRVRISLDTVGLA